MPLGTEEKEEQEERLTKKREAERKRYERMKMKQIGKLVALKEMRKTVLCVKNYRKNEINI